MQFRIERPYTTDRWIRLKVFPLEQKGKVHWVAGMAEDDSSRMKNIFNMQKINARKDSMMEILSHDLRGPIGIVQSLTALIEEDLSTVDIEQSREQLQLIQKICKRNIDLIRDLVHQEFLESAQVDSMKFMQVINNLISNALKFTHDDGIISIHIEKKKGTVLISVSDNGIGIPKKFHPVLFDKFTEARRPELKGEESVGLGMSVIKIIVELHEGKIWFESEENKGSTFYIQLSTEKE